MGFWISAMNPRTFKKAHDRDPENFDKIMGMVGLYMVITIMAFMLLTALSTKTTPASRPARSQTQR